MAESEVTTHDKEVPRLVVIDTDPGVDDAEAISMMLSAERRGELRVLALTITFGNSTMKQCSRNARRILSVCDRLDIPIYSGAHSGLVNGKLGTTDLFHGKNGMGDAHFEEPLPKVKRHEEHAVTALVRLAREHKGELIILALALLTNIAMATRMDPEFTNNVQHIYVMGGNFTGMGNTTPSGEFNFFSDPEAANIVLATARRPITIASWELCLNHDLDMEDEFHGWITCDQVAAALLIRPEIALKTSTHHATVELQGEYTRGQMVVDRRGWHASRNESRLNVNIVETLDIELYKKMLLDAFGHPNIEL